MGKNDGKTFIYKNKIGPTNRDIIQTEARLNASGKIFERHRSEREGDKRLKGYLEKVKRSLYKMYTLSRDDFPIDEYLKFQRRVAEELGYGQITNLSEEAIETEIKVQQESLGHWVDYFLSDDSSSFPIWAKYWAFHGVLSMSGTPKVDPNTLKITFSKREKNTFGPFVELNREAFAKSVEFIVKKVEEGINLEQALENKDSFRHIYSYFINKLRGSMLPEKLQVTEGNWIRYKKGDSDDLQKLVGSLAEKGTGWCTASFLTAKEQLKVGDFYVYYSKNDSGTPNPRIAIRMQGTSIMEVRGIGADQNLDSVIAGTGILDTKLSEFGTEGDKYKKRSSDMKKLTEIKKKKNKGEELNEEDLRFLYEMDRKIEGFGYSKDPRIEEIINSRNKRSDIAKIIGCREDEISLSMNEALKGGIKLHFGDLYLYGLTDARELTLPQSVGGYLDLRDLTDARGLTLPQSVGGFLNLSGLTHARGLTLPQSVGGLNLSGLTHARGLTLPQSVGGLNLSGLTDARGLTLPQSVGEYLYLSGLKDARGLTLPQSVGGSLDLSGLKDARGLTLPQSVGGDLDLSGLKHARGLTLPQSVGGKLIFNNLIDISRVTLSENFNFRFRNIY
jgi:hypothetical protein